MDILTLLVLLVGELGLDAESMGTEVVALSLQKVGRKILRSISIVEAESSAEGWSGDTPESTLADNISPASLSLMDGGVEELVEEEVLKIRVLAVRAGDVLQEDRSDDATSTPHEGDFRLVQLPTILRGGLEQDRMSNEQYADSFGLQS